MTTKNNTKRSLWNDYHERNIYMITLYRQRQNRCTADRRPWPGARWFSQREKK